MPFFSKSQSFLSMYTFLASYHSFFLSTSVTFLWFALLPPHSIHHHLHLGCSGAPVVSARDKRMRAPGGPRLLRRTSVTLSQSCTHTGTCPPLSHEGSALGCYGNLGKVSLSWPDCVELRTDGACHTVPCWTVPHRVGLLLSKVSDAFNDLVHSLVLQTSSVIWLFTYVLVFVLRQK